MSASKDHITNPTVPRRELATRIRFKLDTWREPIDGFIHISDNEIAVAAYIETVACWDEMRFCPYVGLRIKHLLRTWACLSLGKPIPISCHDIVWVTDGNNVPCLRITPCWPADFSLLIWFPNQSDIEPILHATENMWMKRSI